MHDPQQPHAPSPSTEPPQPNAAPAWLGQRILLGVGRFTLLILGVGAVIFGYMAFRGRGLDEESKHYVDDAVPAIVSHWDVGPLSKRASPELMASGTPEEMAKAFHFFSKLGALKVYKGARGDASLFLDVTRGMIVTARYRALVEFDRGPAQIDISLVKRNGGWKVCGFNVNSQALAEDR